VLPEVWPNRQIFRIMLTFVNISISASDECRLFLRETGPLMLETSLRLVRNPPIRRFDNLSPLCGFQKVCREYNDNCVRTENPYYKSPDL